MSWDDWFCAIMLECIEQYSELARRAMDHKDWTTYDHYHRLAELSSICRTKGLHKIAKSMNDRA